MTSFEKGQLFLVDDDNGKIYLNAAHPLRRLIKNEILIYVRSLSPLVITAITSDGIYVSVDLKHLKELPDGET